MKDIKLIGVGGYARTGKDTFARKLQKILKENGQEGATFAFADRLKKDLNHFLSKNMGISSHTDIKSEKNIIRPILVAYGEAQRACDSDYWIKKIERTIDNAIDLGVICIVTDVRYENEAEWISKNGTLIFLEREQIKPPNSQEIENTPKVRQKAKIIVNWPTTSDEDKLDDIVRGLVQQLTKENNA